MYACILPTDAETELHLLRDGKTRSTAGSIISSVHNLCDTSGVEGQFFIFPDLSVRMEGTYRLKFTLYRVVDNEIRYCATTISCNYSVYPAKKFPGMEGSTALFKCFAEQGLKVRIRKDVRARGFEVLTRKGGKDKEGSTKKRKSREDDVVALSQESSNHSDLKTESKSNHSGDHDSRTFVPYKYPGYHEGISNSQGDQPIESTQNFSGHEGYHQPQYYYYQQHQRPDYLRPPLLHPAVIRPSYDNRYPFAHYYDPNRFPMHGNIPASSIQVKERTYADQYFAYPHSQYYHADPNQKQPFMNPPPPHVHSGMAPYQYDVPQPAMPVQRPAYAHAHLISNPTTARVYDTTMSSSLQISESHTLARGLSSSDPIRPSVTYGIRHFPNLVDKISATSGQLPRPLHQGSTVPNPYPKIPNQLPPAAHRVAVNAADESRRNSPKRLEKKSPPGIVQLPEISPARSQNFHLPALNSSGFPSRNRAASLIPLEIPKTKPGYVNLLQSRSNSPQIQSHPPLIPELDLKPRTSQTSKSAEIGSDPNCGSVSPGRSRSMSESVSKPGDLSPKRKFKLLPIETLVSQISERHIPIDDAKMSYTAPISSSGFQYPPKIDTKRDYSYHSQKSLGELMSPSEVKRPSTAPVHAHLRDLSSDQSYALLLAERLSETRPNCILN